MIWGKLKLWAVIAAGAALAVLGAFWGGQRVGRAKSKTDALQRRLKDAGRASEVQDEVNKMDRASKRRDLDRWLRDNDNE